MADIVSSETRSRMMSGIRGKDTKPEIILRQLLHGNGYRYRLHRKDLPGKPDIILAGKKTVIFVNGCYWHGHEDCHLFRLPKSRTEFWTEKIAVNRLRDQKNYDKLGDLGWKVVVVWECAVTKKLRLSNGELLNVIEDTFRSSCKFSEIRSR